jgi:hypothetical protein
VWNSFIKTLVTVKFRERNSVLFRGQASVP